MGHAASDLFYPDNPKRRRRAEELRAFITQCVAEFEEEQNKRKELIETASDKLDKVLKSQGIMTRQDLIEKVKNKLKDDAEILKYDELMRSLDSNDRAQTLIFDIASLAGLATAGIAGLGWVMGICSGAAAMGAIEVVGGLAVAAMIAEAVLAAIQGAQERQKLREAIHTLVERRVEAQLFLGQIRIINQYVRGIVRDLDAGKSIEDMAKDLADGIKSDWDDYNTSKVTRELADIDRKNASWTNEDNWGSYYMAVALNADADVDAGEKPILMASVTFTPRGTGDPHKVLWRLAEVVSKSVCIATAENGDRWTIEARENAENVSWDLQRIPEGQSRQSEIFQDCTIQVHESSKR